MCIINLVLNQASCVLLFYMKLQHVSYLLDQPLWQQVLHKLLEELFGHGVVEECDLAVDDPQYGGRAVGSEVVSQTPLIAHVHHADAHACIHRHTHTHTHNGRGQRAGYSTLTHRPAQRLGL